MDGMCGGAPEQRISQTGIHAQTTEGAESPLAAAHESGGMPLTREIPGRYREIREYARGGMGRILVVHDRDTGREVALKELIAKSYPDGTTISPDQADQGAGVRHIRFLREVRVTGQLEHPSIVPIYELGRRSDGTLYYTMKLIRGRTLGQALLDAQTLSERLDLLPHFVDLCQAIAYAHSRGIVHRDIKPSNVLLGTFGETVVIDWGLATAIKQREEPVVLEKPRENCASDDRLTREGQSLGTPRYMSPEQIRGDLSAIAEPSDVYALGTVLYEILCGQHPYADSDTAALFHDVLSRDPAPVKTLEPKAPAELAAICLRAMSRRPGARYAHAGELVNEIKRFQAGALVTAYQYSPLDRLKRFARRHAAVLSSVAVAFLAVIIMGGLAIAGILREQAETEFALYQASINLAHNAIDNRRFEEAEEALARAPTSHRGLEWGLVQGMCHPERMVLRGHIDVVEYAAYSPDGSRIVTCAHDQTAIIWDAQTGRNVHEFRLPDEFFHRALWSSDGAWLILTTRSERICVYDARDYSLLREMRGYAPAISPDATLLAAATEYGQVVSLYDPATGAVVRTFPKVPVHMIHIAYSADGRHIAAAVDDGSVWVWSLDSDSAWHTPPVHAPSTRFVAFSPDSDILLSTGADGCGVLWDATTGAELRRLEGHEAGISGACFIPGRQLVLTASNDRTIRIWDVNTGKEMGRHDGFSSPLAFVALSPDGTEFITHIDSSRDRMAAVILPVTPLRQRQTLAAHSGPVNAVAFSPDGAVLASGAGSWRYANDDRVILWNTRDYSRRMEIKTGNGSVHSVVFFANGTRIATGNQNGSASIYDASTGACLKTFMGHSDVCRSVAVSPDEKTLATASWNGDAILWDMASGKQRMLPKADPYRLDVIAFEPRGRYVVTGGMDGRVRMWDVLDGRQIGMLEPKEEQRVSAIAFSPDGRSLLTGGDVGRVILWDVERRQPIRTFKGHKSIVYAVAFSSDGQRIVTAGKDAAIWFWDVNSGRQVMFLERHRETVSAIALRSDNGQLASASDDATVVLWPIVPNTSL